MKKSILKVSGFNESEGSVCFAISSQLSEINICLLFNKALTINLSLLKLTDVDRKGEILKFPVYFFESDEGIDKYYLFVNRIGMQYLIPGIKIDYLFLMQSEGNLVPAETKLTELKSEPGIIALHKLDAKNIRPVFKLIH